MEVDFSPAFRARFRLGRKLGAGAMGVVYAAHDTKLERPVAIKVLNPRIIDEEGLARFHEEARVTASLRHEGIVTLFEAGSDGPLPYMIFELVQGFSLRRYMKAKKRVSVRKALSVTRLVAEALAYAHGLGVVHRDVKPDNVLVAGADCVKLADFGIARAVSRRSCRTATGIVLGTVAYMAPEQIAEQEVTPAVDLYALGVVLYELLAGRQPFRGSTVEVAAAQIRHEAPRLVPDDVEGLGEVAELVAWALHKDPARRIPSARVFAERCAGLAERAAQEGSAALFSNASQADLALSSFGLSGSSHELPPRPVPGATDATTKADAPGEAAPPPPLPPAAPRRSWRFLVPLVLAGLLGLAALRIGGRTEPFAVVPGSLAVRAAGARAEVRWESNRPAPGVVETRPARSSGGAWRRVEALSRGAVTSHRLVVADLEPGDHLLRVLFPGGGESLTVPFAVAPSRGPRLGSPTRPDRSTVVLPVESGEAGTLALELTVGGTTLPRRSLPLEPGVAGEARFREGRLFLLPAFLATEWTARGLPPVRETLSLPSFVAAFRSSLASSRVLALVRELERSTDRDSCRRLMGEALAEFDRGPVGPALRELALGGTEFFRRGQVTLEDRRALYHELEPLERLQLCAELGGERSGLPVMALRDKFVTLREGPTFSLPPWVAQREVFRGLPERLSLGPGRLASTVVVDLTGAAPAPGERAVLAVRHLVTSDELLLRVELGEGCNLLLWRAGRQLLPPAVMAQAIEAGNGTEPLVWEAVELPDGLLPWGGTWSPRFRFDALPLRGTRLSDGIRVDEVVLRLERRD